jgi:hypothetical protein
MPRKSHKSVFVVGAGASVEFGLPTGRGLLSQINDLGKKEYDSDGYLTRTSFPAPFESALEYIKKDLISSGYSSRDATLRLRRKATWICDIAPLAPSIDNLIHTHQSDSDVAAIGKAIIAYLIHEGERKSHLADVQLKSHDWGPFPFVHRAPNGNKLIAETWLGELFRYLVELNDFNNFIAALDDITFISFNYDRCIEQFLTSAAQRYFQLDSDDTRRCLESINVVHPYGSLGELSVTNNQIVGFASRSADVYGASKMINTFTEGMTNTDVGSRIRGALDSAERVFFLGFGFLDLNLDLLFEEGPFHVSSIVGTHKGISKTSAQLISNKLAEQLLFGKSDPVARPSLMKKSAGNMVELHDLTCAELLQQYQFFIRD